jgi:hypothetical protein
MKNPPKFRPTSAKWWSEALSFSLWVFFLFAELADEILAISDVRLLRVFVSDGQKIQHLLIFVRINI